jgi:hypothetical protein
LPSVLPPHLLASQTLRTHRLLDLPLYRSLDLTLRHEASSWKGRQNLYRKSLYRLAWVYMDYWMTVFLHSPRFDWQPLHWVVLFVSLNRRLRMYNAMIEYQYLRGLYLGFDLDHPTFFQRKH